MKTFVKIMLFCLFFSLPHSFALAQDRLAEINKDVEQAKPLVAENAAERDAIEIPTKEEDPPSVVQRFRGEVNEGTIFEGVGMPKRSFNNIRRRR